MRVALVAPIEEPVPPKQYGGIESVVHDLAVGLSERGHAVTLLAAGDSTWTDDLVPLAPAALRNSALRDAPPEALERLKVEAAARAAEWLADAQPEVIHNHMWRLLRFSDQFDRPMVTTVHYPLDRDDRRRTGFDQAQNAALVSISRNQQRAAHGMRFIGNVYNGIDVDSFEPRYERGSGLLFLGRLAPEKGADLAIQVAHAVGLRLTIAAKRVPEAEDYCARAIWPHVDGQRIRYVGEVDQATKRRLLRQALALLYPVRWTEPFGLAMVEAMACGTPVIAFNRGASAEVVASGRTGFVVDSLVEMMAAVCRIGEISRRACREYVSERFSARRMVAGYEAIYAMLIGRCES